MKRVQVAPGGAAPTFSGLDELAAQRCPMPREAHLSKASRTARQPRPTTVLVTLRLGSALSRSNEAGGATAASAAAASSVARLPRSASADALLSTAAADAGGLASVPPLPSARAKAAAAAALAGTAREDAAARPRSLRALAAASAGACAGGSSCKDLARAARRVQFAPGPLLPPCVASRTPVTADGHPASEGAAAVPVRHAPLHQWGGGALGLTRGNVLMLEQLLGPECADSVARLKRRVGLLPPLRPARPHAAVVVPSAAAHGDGAQQRAGDADGAAPVQPSNPLQPQPQPQPSNAQRRPLHDCQPKQQQQQQQQPQSQPQSQPQPPPQPRGLRTLKLSIATAAGSGGTGRTPARAAVAAPCSTR